jgi:hypothetical protein
LADVYVSVIEAWNTRVGLIKLKSI